MKLKNIFHKLLFVILLCLSPVVAQCEMQGTGVGDAGDPNSQNAITAFGSAQVGMLHPQVSLRFNYGLNTRIYDNHTANGGTFTVANGLASVQSGTNSAGFGGMHSHASSAYTPGQGARARFTASFTACVADSTQYAGITDNVDGFAFGCDGATYGLAVIKDSVFTWTAQADWNVDTMDGDGPSGMDISEILLNVYQIQYQWLGAGQINYFIEDDDTGQFVLVHSIKYANRFTVPSISNPTLPVSLHAINTGNTTNLTVKSSSMSAFTEGIPGSSGFLNGGDTGEISYLTASGEVPILTVRSRATYLSKTNRIEVDVLDVSVTSDGTKGVIFRIYLDSSLTGASFSDIDTNESVVEIDTSTTAITGGHRLISQGLSKVDSKDINTAEWKLVMHPGDSITVTAESSANSIVTADVVWREKF